MFHDFFLPQCPLHLIGLYIYINITFKMDRAVIFLNNVRHVKDILKNFDILVAILDFEVFSNANCYDKYHYPT